MKAISNTKNRRRSRLAKTARSIANFVPHVGSVGILSQGALSVGFALGGAALAPSAVWANACVAGPPWTNGDDGYSCNTVTVGDINMLGGSDSLTLFNDLGPISVDGSIFGGDGNDYLQVYSSPAPAAFGPINLGNLGDDIFDMGAGDDIVYLYQYVDQPVSVTGSLVLGTGDDRFGVENGVQITGSIDGGSGTDRIYLGANFFGNPNNLTPGITPVIEGNVYAGEGDDYIKLTTNTTIVGSIYGGSGVDVIELQSGFVSGDVDWGAGDEFQTLDLTNANVSGSLLFGDGSDQFELNGGLVSGNVYLDGPKILTGLSGNDDDFTLSGGIVSGFLTGGVGNDRIELRSGSVDGGVEGNEGDDTIVWEDAAATTPSVLGGAGSDVVNISNAGIDLTGVVLDGGDDYSDGDGMIDVLTLVGWDGEIDGSRLLKWEQIVLSGGADVSFGPTLEVGGGNGLGLIVEDGSLDGSDAFALTGNLINNSLVTTLDGALGDVVTVSANYSGSGNLSFDTNLETATSDTLVIGGDVLESSTTAVTANVIGGSATGEAIRLISVLGVNNGAYSLVGGPIESGVWTYDLAAAQNVDLIAQINAVGAVYESAPSVLLGGFASLPTLEQRVGQRQWLLGGAESVDGVWMRLHGESADVSPSDSESASSWSSSAWGLQVGADVIASESENGYWVLGVTGQYGNISADVSNALGGGDINGSGYGLGATATWHGYGGTYVDLQGQANWISVDYSTAANGALASDSSVTATALSAEFGHRYTLDDSRKHALVPQAQLSWGQVSGDSFTDSEGNDVALGTNTRTIGRIGLAYEYRPNGLTEGQRANDEQMVYAIVNILHDFSSASSVDVAGTTLQSSGESTWGEIGIGGSVAVAPDAMLYGQASYRQALSGHGSDNNSLHATVGLRFQW